MAINVVSRSEAKEHIRWTVAHDEHALTVAQLPITKLAVFIGVVEGAEELGAANGHYFR